MAAPPGGSFSLKPPERRPIGPIYARNREIETGGQVPESRMKPHFYVENPGR